MQQAMGMHPIHRMHENAHECTLYQMHCNATLKVRMNEGKQMHRTRIAECNLHECVEMQNYALPCSMCYHAACVYMRYHANASCISHNLIRRGRGRRALSPRGAETKSDEYREASPCMCVDRSRRSSAQAPIRPRRPRQTRSRTRLL